MFLRERALEGPLDERGIKRVLAVDNASGLIAITWMGSGLVRAFTSLEKGTSFYLHSPMFWTKMGLLTVAWGFEMLPMLTFLRWRGQLAKGEPVDLSKVPRIRALHWGELACVALTLFVATLMARGVGQIAPSVGATQASLLAAGEQVYTARCAVCHQPDGRGRSGAMAADFVGDRTRLAKDDAALLRSIEQGVPNTAMRAFANEIDVSQRRAVLAYIRARFGTH